MSASDESNDLSNVSSSDDDDSVENDNPSPKRARLDVTNTADDDDVNDGQALPQSALHLPSPEQDVMKNPSLTLTLSPKHCSPRPIFFLQLIVLVKLNSRKKTDNGVEFVKRFQAHDRTITGLSASINGSLAASSGDTTIKIFDVVNFDMINVIKYVSLSPRCLDILMIPNINWGY